MNPSLRGLKVWSESDLTCLDLSQVFIVSPVTQPWLWEKLKYLEFFSEINIKSLKYSKDFKLCGSQTFGRWDISLDWISFWQRHLKILSEILIETIEYTIGRKRYEIFQKRLSLHRLTQICLNFTWYIEDWRMGCISICTSKANIQVPSGPLCSVDAISPNLMLYLMFERLTK